MLVHPKGCPQSFFTSFPQRVAVRYQYNWLLRDVVEQSSSFSKRDVSDHFRSKIRCICDKHQTTSPPNEITRSELNFCQCISSILQHYTLKLSQTSTFSLVPVLWNDCERDRGPPGALQGPSRGREQERPWQHVCPKRLTPIHVMALHRPSPPRCKFLV